MALAKSLYEVIENICNQNSNITEQNKNIIRSCISQGGTKIPLLNLIPRVDWLDESYFQSHAHAYQWRYYFNWQEVEDFLKQYSADKVFKGRVDAGVIIDKKSLYNQNNMLFYLGTSGEYGNLQQRQELSGFYYTTEKNPNYEKGGGGVYTAIRTVIGTTTKALCIGIFETHEGYGYSANQPFFKNSVSYSSVQDALPITQNISNMNIYSAINSEAEEEPFYLIKDDSQNIYHCFKIFNKKQFNTMLSLWDIIKYYKNKNDLILGQNPVSVEIEPEPPKTPTAPGQKPNKAQNNYTGTGDKTSDKISIPTQGQAGGVAGLLSSAYGLNYNELLKVQGTIWNSDFWESLKSLSVNLTNPIINCIFYPFNITDYTGLSVDNKIVIGNYTLNIDSTIGDVWKMTPTYNPKIILVENFTLKPIYGCFLDNEPYTTIKLYLPYIGIVDVDGNLIYNKKITIYYNVDVINNKGQAVIEVEGNPVYYFDCVLGVNISFSESNYNSIRQQAIIGGLFRGLSGGIGGLGRVIAGQAENIASSENTISGGGTNGSTIGRMNSQFAYFIIETVETAIPENYNQTEGRPSLITEKLEKIKGFTIINNPLINTTATREEQQEIINNLKEGVYL